MKVAIVHYHLRTGGVSQVIADQSEALTEAGIPHLILSSGPQSKDLPQALIPNLDYCNEASYSAEELLTDMFRACEQALGGAPDLWHFHNPTLGKHVLYPAVINLLAKRRDPLILQTHDFAEDNRPANFALLGDEDIYPAAPQIHYAFLNQRDQTAFAEVGLASSQSHLLPNTVKVIPPGDDNSKKNNGDALVLYPVRGIRRKNLGEVLLLAALSPPKTRFAISLAPENEQWREHYLHWRELAEELSLPISFDVTDHEPPIPGSNSHYPDWQQHATHFLTTSVAEGFGFAFLEPLALGKPLLGRDLPDITCDFRSHGIEHRFLYQRLPIPLAELDSSALRAELTKAIQRHYLCYGRTAEDSAIEIAWRQLTKRSEVDFGNLPEDLQETFVRRACQATTDPNSLFPQLACWLQKVLGDQSSQELTAGLAHYSPQAGKRRLLALYDEALNSQRTSPRWLDREAILSQFLHPQRFHFLRR